MVTVLGIGLIPSPIRGLVVWLRTTVESGQGTPHHGASFNGRTLVFGTSHGGSTPPAPASLLTPLPLVPAFFAFLFSG